MGLHWLVSYDVYTRHYCSDEQIVVTLWAFLPTALTCTLAE